MLPKKDQIKKTHMSFKLILIIYVNIREQIKYNDGYAVKTFIYIIDLKKS